MKIDDIPEKSHYAPDYQPPNLKSIRALQRDTIIFAGSKGHESVLCQSWSFKKIAPLVAQRYLDSYLRWSQTTKKQLQHMCSSILSKMCNLRPFVTTNLFTHNSNMNQDIALKFSAFVHHIFVQI